MKNAFKELVTKCLSHFQKTQTKCIWPGARRTLPHLSYLFCSQHVPKLHCKFGTDMSIKSFGQKDLFQRLSNEQPPQTILVTTIFSKYPLLPFQTSENILAMNSHNNLITAAKYYLSCIKRFSFVKIHHSSIRMT